MARKAQLVKTYGRRALAHYRKKDFRRALDDFSKVIELEPTNVPARFCRGRLLEEIGLCDQAIVDFTEIIRMKPTHVKAYVHRGLAHFMQEEDDLALEDFSKAIQLAPEHVEALAVRGMVFTRNVEPDKAIADYIKVIKLAPGLFEEIRPVLKLAYLRTGPAPMAANETIPLLNTVFDSKLGTDEVRIFEPAKTN
jgi:tetratricopeptide (TPR) repeat protein